MGRIVLRGSRTLPKVYADYYDSDGTRRTRLLAGVRTKAEGRELLAEIVARVAAQKRGVPMPELRAAAEPSVVGPLMRQWMEGLENRNARLDRQRAARHLLPVWEEVTIEAVQQLPAVMRWLDAMKRTGALSQQSMRHNLNLLSRFLAWAVERGFAVINPVRHIPSGKRPQGAPKQDGPWIREEGTFWKFYEALPVPVRYLFWLGNRSGLRPDEARGLRMSDLAWLADGAIRIRFSGAGPLKEDRRGQGKVKWAPGAGDATAVLGPWLKRRRLDGAGPEDLVFIPVVAGCRPRRSAWQGVRKEFVQSCWEQARDACGVSMTFYEATRHSFISRNLEAGVPLDEVSAAVGHSSPVVTKRHYDRFIRRSFSDAIRGIKSAAR